jgi:hypothetical protein
MSRSSAALLRRVRTMKRKLNEPQSPRDYIMVLEMDEPVSEALMSQLREFDTLTVRRYQKGYAPDLAKAPQSMSCLLKGPRGGYVPCVLYG